MRVYGIDFTSSPSYKKPITCLECTLEGDALIAGEMRAWAEFKHFEAALREPGPWITGIDFPFGQARRFIETIGWPQSWQGYVQHAASLGKAGYEDALESYAKARPDGGKHHFRICDKRANSQSPQKLHFVPVAKMFFQGAPRLIEAGVTIPGLQIGDPRRIVVEAYPGVLARYLIGNKPYKGETRKHQSAAKNEARRAILQSIEAGELKVHYGLSVTAPTSLASDPTGDTLDALLCAIQAAWAYTKRDQNYGMPAGTDPLEGWIADPMPGG